MSFMKINKFYVKESVYDANALNLYSNQKTLVLVYEKYFQKKKGFNVKVWIFNFERSKCGDYLLLDNTLKLTISKV